MRQHRIVTPEQVTFRLTAAGLATRASAWLVDQLLLTLLRLAVIIVLAQGGEFGISLAVAAYVFADVVYYIWCEWRLGGQTPGKRAFGLRVASLSGARLSFQEVFIRNIFRILDNMPIVLLLGLLSFSAMLVGGVSAFCDRLGRRVGDLAAGTMVVRERRAAFSPPQADRDRPNSYKDDPACRRRVVTRATREDRDLAIELMWRRDELRPEIREDLFRRLAGEFKRRFALPDDASLTDEQSVMDVALLLCERDEG